MINAIILAGTSKNKNLSQIQDKALLKINGKHMIEYIIEALKNVKKIDKIIVLGQKKELDRISHLVYMVIDSDDSMMEKIIKGSEYFDKNNDLLICSCDIPLITSESISDFLNHSIELNADVTCPIVAEKVFYNTFSNKHQTFIRFKEGSFKTGNIFYVKPKVLLDGMKIANKLFSLRKNPLRMTGVLGINFIFKLIFRKLSIKDVEDKLLSLSHYSTKAIVSKYPEIGYDVDKYSDLTVTESYIKNSR